MADVTIASDQLASPWTIQNAAPDPTTGEVDEYNAAIALGAQIGIWYGDRIKAQSAAVLADTEQVASLQADIEVLQGKTPETLPLGEPGSSVAQSIATAIDLIRATGKDGNTTYQNSAALGLRITLKDSTLTDRDYYPITETGRPFPANTTDTNGLISGRVYRALDGRIFLYDLYYPSPHIVEVTSAIPMLRNAPTGDLFASWQKALQDEAEKLTQVSQSKQAFLQELIASMSKYLSFATSLVQRYERNRLDIIGRF